MSTAASETPTAEHNIIIDTDVGCDDAVAIAFALAAPKDKMQVHAITSLFGNVTNAQALENIAIVLKLFKQEHIPFYAGADKPLVDKMPESWLGHGPNGLGGSDFTDEIAREYPGGDTSLPKASSEHAVDALVRMARERPGFYEIMAIGPLTNIALAVKKDPQFATNVKTLLWMGGSASGKGNATLCAEFNAHADAEAASVVFRAWPDLRLVMVPWELCASAAISWREFHAFTATGATLLARFMKRVSLCYETLGTGTVKMTDYLPSDVRLPKLAELFSPGGDSHYKKKEGEPDSDADSAAEAAARAAASAAAAADEGKGARVPATEAGCESGECVNDPHRYISSKFKYVPADLYAFYAMLHMNGPEIVRTKEAHCLVETGGTIAKGFIAVDWCVCLPGRLCFRPSPLSCRGLTCMCELTGSQILHLSPVLRFHNTDLPKVRIFRNINELTFKLYLAEMLGVDGKKIMYPNEHA